MAGHLLDEDSEAPSRRRADTTGTQGEAPAPLDPADARTEERAHWREVRSKVREALVAELRIAPEEEEALAELVCPMRENERSFFDEYAGGSIDSAAMWRGLADERNAATEEMRRALGEERYEKLREVGGLGILARTVCGRRR